jgi:hypothetical protein
MARPNAPGPIVIPNCVQVELLWNNASRNWKNVLHGIYSGTRPIPAALAETLFTAFKAQFTSSAVGTGIDTGTHFAAVQLKDLNQAYSPYVASTSASVPGTDATGPLPLNDALVVTLLTAQTGQSHRGRVYLGGLGMDARATSIAPSPAFSSAALAFIEGILSAMTANAVPACIANRALLAGTDHAGNPLPARPATTTPVTGAKMTGNRLDSQRRRIGRG